MFLLFVPGQYLVVLPSVLHTVFTVAHSLLIKYSAGGRSLCVTHSFHSYTHSSLIKYSAGHSSFQRWFTLCTETICIAQYALTTQF